MDTAVALVQTYLHLNGYFTVVEFPVMEAVHANATRTVTDLDILAFRFPRAHAGVIRHASGDHVIDIDHSLIPDPVLGCPRGEPDMIVGEVKEGAARFNDAAWDPDVLAVALARFGCCGANHAAEIAGALLKQGRTTTPEGHSLRMVAFGTADETYSGGRITVVPIRHVVKFVRGYLHQHRAVMRSMQIKDSTLSLLALLEKWGIGDVSDAAKGPHADGPRHPTR